MHNRTRRTTCRAGAIVAMAGVLALVGPGSAGAATKTTSKAAKKTTKKVTKTTRKRVTTKAATTLAPATTAPAAPTTAAPAPAARDLSKLTGKLAVAVYGGPTLTSWNKNFADAFKKAAPRVDLVLGGEANPSALAFSQKGNPQYDLLLVTGANAASIKASKDALYEPIDPAVLSRSSRVFKDIQYKDASGKWVAAPVFLTLYGLVGNADLVRTEQVNSWADIAGREYRGRVLLNGPFFWTTTDITMFALANGGSRTDLDPAFDLLKRVIPNVKTTISTLADAAAQMKSGEVDFAPFYFSQYSQLVDQGLNVKWIVPKEGLLNSPLYLMVPKGAKNQENALAFVDFVLQAAQQEAVQDQSSYIPVTDDASLIDKVQKRSGFATASDLVKKTIIPDFDLLAARQQANIKKMEDLLAK